VNIGIRNSVPRGAENSHRKGNRMALENTRQRLQGCFGEAASLTLSEVDGEHQVRVVFPYVGEVG
jgi:two-component system sensor histidine kinase AlgZ